MLQELLNDIKDSDKKNLCLFFINRTLKPNVRSRDRVLEKYDYKVFQVNIDDEIRSYLYSLSLEQIEYAIKKKFEIVEYDIISDSTDQLYTYQMINKTMSFVSVVNDQLPDRSSIPQLQNLSELIEIGSLWAYCVGYLPDIAKPEDWIYTFRKIANTKLIIDEKDADNKTIKQKFIRAVFNNKSNKLQFLHGETITLDKQIDCIYKVDTFYILKKREFERMVGLEEDFKQQAEETIDKMAETNMFKGLDFIRKEIEESPSIHKKLIKIQKLETYQGLKQSDIKRMEKTARLFGSKLKTDDGKIVIEDKADIELAIRLLCEYYKEGMVTKKKFGTYSGKIMKTSE